MLVMRRRAGEAIMIGDNVEVRILCIGRTKVKLGIIAPREIPVVAREIELMGQQNIAAAQSKLDLALSAALLKALGTPAGPLFPGVVSAAAAISANHDDPADE